MYKLLFEFILSDFTIVLIYILVDYIKLITTNCYELNKNYGKFNIKTVEVTFSKRYAPNFIKVD